MRVGSGLGLLGFVFVAALGWGVDLDPGLVGTWAVTEPVTARTHDAAGYHFVKATVEVVVTVGADGSVTGTVGGAHFEGCRVAVNRNALERWLNLRTDWIFRGRLVGRMFPGDPFETRDISAPFNRDGDGWNGTLFHQQGFEGFPSVNLALMRQ